MNRLALLCFAAMAAWAQTPPVPKPAATRPARASCGRRGSLLQRSEISAAAADRDSQGGEIHAAQWDAAVSAGRPRTSHGSRGSAGAHGQPLRPAGQDRAGAGDRTGVANRRHARQDRRRDRPAVGRRGGARGERNRRDFGVGGFFRVEGECSRSDGRISRRADFARIPAGQDRSVQEPASQRDFAAQRQSAIHSGARIRLHDLWTRQPLRLAGDLRHHRRR